MIDVSNFNCQFLVQGPSRWHNKLHYSLWSSYQCGPSSYTSLWWWQWKKMTAVIAMVKKLPSVSYQAHHGIVSNKKHKKSQKGQPVSTTCSTLSMPVHNIVWSKELYKLLLHSKVEESIHWEDPKKKEPSTSMIVVSSLQKLLTISSEDTPS